MTNAKVFLVNGKIKSGKDSLCKYAVEYLTSIGKTCLILKQAAPIKQMVGALMGIHDITLFEERELKNAPQSQLGGLSPREAFQLVGQGVRNIDSSFWGSILAHTVKLYMSEYDYIFISDWRFHEEREILSKVTKIEAFNLHTIRIERDDQRTNKLISEQIEERAMYLGYKERSCLIVDDKSLMMRAKNDVLKILDDISETALDSRIKTDYFSLVLPNIEGDFYNTKLTFTEYLKRTLV